MARELEVALNEYLHEQNSDGFLYSGPIDQETADRLVRLIEQRTGRRNKVSLFLTTFGGDPNAAYRIGRALDRHYSKGGIRLLIGGYCKSAGTLICLSATELAFGCLGELGPLDTQVAKTNEIIGFDSGLDLIQAIDQITDSAFRSFEKQMLNLIQRSNAAITTIKAAEIASSMAVGLFSPITAQIDPLRLGVIRRAMQIGEVYGSRLKSRNVKGDTVRRLVRGYPAHGTVIDKTEAERLFQKVEWFSLLENEIYGCLEQILREPDEKGLVFDLRELQEPSGVPSDGTVEGASAADEQNIGGTDGNANPDSSGETEDDTSGGPEETA